MNNHNLSTFFRYLFLGTLVLALHPVTEAAVAITKRGPREGRGLGGGSWGGLGRLSPATPEAPSCVLISFSPFTLRSREHGLPQLSMPTAPNG